MSEIKRVTETSIIGILRSPLNYEWTIHGLGFLRLYLSSVQRLHVWNHLLATPSATPIHDHPWNFESQIVFGRLINRRYMAVPDLGSYRIKIGTEEIRESQSYQRQALICCAGG